jgi:hypothetical protein
VAPATATATPPPRTVEVEASAAPLAKPAQAASKGGSPGGEDPTGSSASSSRH